MIVSAITLNDILVREMKGVMRTILLILIPG